MKNKKLFFTLPLVLALGATACGKGGGGGKKVGPWGAEIEALMKEALYGEVLPYLEEVFKDEEMEFEVWDGIFLLESKGDTFTSDDVEAYAATFEGWEDLSEDVGYPYFTKEVTVEGVQHELDVVFRLVDEDGEDAEEEPAYFSLQAGDPTSWPVDSAAFIIDFLSDGESTAVLPEFEGASAFSANLDYLTLGMGAIMALAPESAIEAYVAKFTAPEWDLHDNGDGSYFAWSADEFIQVDIYFSSYVYIVLSEAPLLSWPTEAINAKLSAYNITETIPALDDAISYEYSGGNTIYCDVPAGTEAAVIEAYEALLVENNYVFTESDPNDGSNYYASPLGQITLNPYQSGTGEVAIFMKLVAQPGPFPLQLVNEFLEEYELGFTLESALPGESFTVNTGSYMIYHYLVVMISGNQVAAFDAILNPIISAVGYEVYDEDETSINYSNEDYHEVQISYDADDDVTEVVFFE